MCPGLPAIKLLSSQVRGDGHASDQIVVAYLRVGHNRPPSLHRKADNHFSFPESLVCSQISQRGTSENAQCPPWLSL